MYGYNKLIMIAFSICIRRYHGKLNFVKFTPTMLIFRSDFHGNCKFTTVKLFRKF